MAERLDLSGYSTAAGAAKALHKYLSEELNGGDDVILYRPEEAGPKRDGHSHWTVSWEGGPYEWATNLTGGESLYRAELGNSFGSSPEVTGFHEQTDWIAEPYYSFDIQFVNQ